MVSAISDDELRSRLQELGEKVGPIIKTTRSLWERKLEKIMAEQEKNRNDRSGFSSDKSEGTLSTRTSVTRRNRRQTIGTATSSSSSRNKNYSNVEESSTTTKLNESSDKSNTSSSHLTSELTRPSVRSSRRSNYYKENSIGTDENAKSTLKVNVRKSVRIRNDVRKEDIDGDLQVGNKSISEPVVCTTTSEKNSHPSHELRLQPLDTVSDEVTATSQSAVNIVQISNFRDRIRGRSPLKRKRTTVSPVTAEAADVIATSITAKEQYYQEKLKMEREYHELRMYIQTEELNMRKEEHKWKLEEHKLRMEMN